MSSNDDMEPPRTNQLLQRLLKNLSKMKNIRIRRAPRPKEKDEPIIRLTRALVLWTGALVFTSICGVVVSTLQWDAMRRQFKTSVVTIAPYFSVESTYIPDIAYPIVIRLKNTGQSSAIEVRFGQKLIYSRKPIATEEPKYYQLRVSDYWPQIDPGRDENMVYYTETVEGLLGTNISQLEAYNLAFVTYEDRFHLKHKQYFCFEYFADEVTKKITKKPRECNPPKMEE